MKTPELVLLGGPNSGKTHYAGQFYGRLQRKPGLLKLRKGGTPSDLSALEDVLRCLEEGRAAEHTPSNTWTDVLLPLIDSDGRAMDLRWPDYGGEQLHSVLETRNVPDTWCVQLQKANGWILLIRLSAEVIYLDALGQLTKRQVGGSEASERAAIWDANARWVEILQILLHVAGHGVTQPLQSPRLAVLLSCYDELSGDPSFLPSDILAERMPLVSTFLKSNWDPDCVSVWGLSALGCALNSDNPNDKFINSGPEHQGWVIAPQGGDANSDLSAPVAWLLNV